MPVEVLRCRVCESEYPADRERYLRPLLRAARAGLRLGRDRADVVTRESIEAGPRSLWRYARCCRPSRRRTPRAARASRRSCPRRGSRRALGVGEVCAQARPREPDALVQGPRRRRRGGEGARVRARDARRPRRPATSRTRSPRAPRRRACTRSSSARPGSSRRSSRRRRSTARRVYGVRGSYDDCSRLVSEFAGEVDWGIVNVNLRSYYAEGSKTLAFEIAEQLGWETPDAVVMPIGSGAMFTKVWQGFQQFERLGLDRRARSRSSTAARPRAARPVASAFAEDRRVSPVRPNTLASSIAIGNPADGDLAIATAQRVGRRRSTRCPRTRSARTSRCSPSTAGIFGEGATGVAVGALREAVAPRRARRERPRRRARHRHRPEDAAAVVRGERPRSSRSTPTSTRCSRAGSDRVTDAVVDELRERDHARRPRAASRPSTGGSSSCGGCTSTRSANGIPLRRPGREDAMLVARCRRANAGPLSDDGRRRALPLRARPDASRSSHACAKPHRLPARRRDRPRGDGRRPCACSRRCRSRSSVEEHLFGGAAIDAVGDPLPAGDARRLPRGRRRAARRGRRPEVGRRRGAARGGADRPAQRARRLREPAPGGRRRDRPADRARARRRPLLRRARRARRRHRLRHAASTTRRRSSGSRGARSSSRAARSGRLLSVDKANVLDTSRLWRRVVTEVAADYPDVELSTGSSTASRCSIVTDPESFDVLVMENTFGDILSDVAAGGHRRARPRRVGEPRRRRPGHLRAGARLGARHRRHRRARTRPRCCARSRWCSSTASASRSSRARVEAAVDAALAHGADARRRRHRHDDRVRRRRARRARGGGRARERPSSAIPGPAGSHSAAASPLLAPRRRDAPSRSRASSPSSRRPSPPRCRSACCRSRTRCTARSPRRTTCSTRRRSRSCPR